MRATGTSRPVAFTLPLPLTLPYLPPSPVCLSSQGINFTRVPFLDNQPVLDLAEKKPYGLLNLLDEEVRLPQGSDAKWLSKCEQQHASHPAWQSFLQGNARLQMEATFFTIKVKTPPLLSFG